MRNLILLVLSTSLFYHCTSPKSKTEITQEFYAASNDYSFEKLDKLTADTVTIIDGSYKADYSKEDYYTLFQWDSVFKPHYTVEYIEASNENVFVKISTTSIRFDYLGNNPLVTTHRLGFDNDKISTIELMEYVEADFNTWSVKRDTLVNWAKVEHPELDGFIFDMTKQGAENYTKAIRLFKEARP